MVKGILKKVTRKDITLFTIVGAIVAIDFFSRVWVFQSEPLALGSEDEQASQLNGSVYGQLPEDQQQKIVDYFVAYDSVNNKKSEDEQGSTDEESEQSGSDSWRNSATRIGDQDFRLVAVLTDNQQQRRAIVLHSGSSGNSDQKTLELKVGDSVGKIKVDAISPQSITLNLNTEKEQKDYVLPLFPRAMTEDTEQENNDEKDTADNES